MSLKALQDFTFTSKYSRYLPDKQRRETWKESVQRSKQMMLDKYFDYNINSYINEAYLAMEQKRVLGSQRALQFAGKPIFKHNARIYNCAGAIIDRISFFQECMYLLLCGCGTGFSVQKHHINKLPKLVTKKSGKKTFVIPDTIEGWSDAIGVLIGSYFNDGLWQDYVGANIEFDFSEIRPEGSYLSSSSGKAPGPAKLKYALEKIDNLLQRCIKNQEFRSIDAYDIVMHSANAVVSGGVRRSATICLFSPDDEDMVNAKTGDWFYTNPQRGRSNNSVVLIRDELKLKEFRSIIDRTVNFGEPGFVLTSNKEMVLNPCISANAVVLHETLGKIRFSECRIGDKIWSKEGWTTITKKWSTGIKPVYKYTTNYNSTQMGENAYFLGTKDHKIFQNRKKVEVGTATYIDVFKDGYINNSVAQNTETNTYLIIKMEYIGEEEVWDITVDNESHSFWCGGCDISNCCEIGFWPYSVTDEVKYNKFNENKWIEIIEKPSDIGLASGWQMCNLSTVNGKKIKSKEDFLSACKEAAVIGTLQAGFNTFPYLGKVTNDIVQREALIGVSITGMMESPEILLNEDIQSEGANLVKDINKVIAKLISINPAARTTCVKPEGTSSCVLGTSSGIHPHHAKRYLRRVQVNRLDNIYQYFKQFNEIACEKSVWSETKSDDVISFCIEVPDGSKIKNQLNALDLLDRVRLTQQNWVAKGKNINLCTQPWLSHNVSNTVQVKPNEWDDVTKYIYENRKYFCGISLLNITGDKDYQQAPFTAIYLPSEMCKHYGDGSMLVSGLIEKALELFEDNLWIACDSLLGIKLIDGKAKKQWIEKCKCFANKYMDKDIKKLTYCMKDVYNWKLWLDLNREYKQVVYEELVEEQDFTNLESEVACAGGACIM